MSHVADGEGCRSFPAVPEEPKLALENIEAAKAVGRRLGLEFPFSLTLATTATPEHKPTPPAKPMATFMNFIPLLLAILLDQITQLHIFQLYNLTACLQS